MPTSISIAVFMELPSVSETRSVADRHRLACGIMSCGIMSLREQTRVLYRNPC